MEITAEPLYARRSSGLSIGISVYSAILLFSSFLIIFGVIWDISWHMSIGRDSFLSPPHIAIYLGGILAGISSIAKLYKITFKGTETERKASVSFWGMKAPLGTLFCIWGAAAMLTSAPFDDWWHNAYGLDVKIVSPPHALLTLGIVSIQFGAILTMLHQQNQKSSHGAGSSGILTALAFGLFFLTACVFIVEYCGRRSMHNPLMYQVVCGLLPLFLISGKEACRVKNSATLIAGVYTFIMLALFWLLPLFPAEPKLAPIRHRVDHMVPMPFPLLLIIPAIMIDKVMPSVRKGKLWLRALVAGAVFFTVFLFCQWCFAYFLMSPFARNAVFGTHYYPYYFDEHDPYRYAFKPYSGSFVQYISSFIFALFLAWGSSALALRWGKWMREVQR